MSVPSHLTSARTWTVRYNLSKECQDAWLESVGRVVDRFAYILIGGPEIGLKKGIRHVHIVVQLLSSSSRKRVLQLLSIPSNEAYAYPKKDRNLLTTYIRHHTKLDTKEDVNVTVLLEYPTAKSALLSNITVKSNVAYKECLDYAYANDLDMIKDLHPGLWIRHHTAFTKFANQMQQQCVPKNHTHLWIYGKPGTGKTLAVQLLFPNHYRRDVFQTFWEGYLDQPVCVLEDLGRKEIKYMGPTRIKTMCDTVGFTIDQKYGGGKTINPRIVVTSNHELVDLLSKLPEGYEWDEVDMEAVTRRFRVISVQEFLEENNLRLKPHRDLIKLGEENSDLRACFVPYHKGMPCILNESVE